MFLGKFDIPSGVVPWGDAVMGFNIEAISELLLKDKFEVEWAKAKRRRESDGERLLQGINSSAQSITFL